MNNTNNAVTITGSGKITAIINGQVYTADTDHPHYDKLLNAARSYNWQEFTRLYDLVSDIKAYLAGGKIAIEDGVVTYLGDVLHNSLTKRIVKFMQNELPVQPLVKFLGNLLNNPSRRAVDELYDFLEVGELPITEDGCFLAFKNVKSDYKDIHSGTFDNSVGKVCEMLRNKVDEDKDRTCSYGLHFCSIAYLPHFRDSDGGHTMIVKINPADVVAIPSDYNNTKGRTCRYEVVAEYGDDWRSRLDRDDNGFDHDLYDEEGDPYEDDDYDVCQKCHKVLTPDVWDGNRDLLCGECYDDQYSGCCGGGCHGGTTLTEEDSEALLDKVVDDVLKKPSPTPYHDVRDEKGRFTKKDKSVLDALKSFFKK
jgi:hypothetical protein